MSSTCSSFSTASRRRRRDITYEDVMQSMSSKATIKASLEDLLNELVGDNDNNSVSIGVIGEEYFPVAKRIRRSPSVTEMSSCTEASG
eukprot:CAMPEP_0198722416 /NCGR_PEP_ID=MMETSP1475-20131203/153_1 /TAXON_ID= ORGANISM="Unidentified sp., Strain CCMP1999" /NCGR_SAMPLE_ID=MMETSP1475 /ASSEMBLY_ACC=CAM_ASM_001111 /LENGTH=87 /DNA_ID=CAMNT_0044483321 /DNA_START=85 /DNA_END=348 /DNA_ORIENTATION=-